MRYINLKADDVVRMMHNEELATDDAPAGYQVNLINLIMGNAEVDASPGIVSSKVLRVNFGSRSAA